MWHVSLGYTKHGHTLRPQAHRAWFGAGWESVEGGASGGMPELNPNRNPNNRTPVLTLMSWPILWNSMGQKVGERAYGVSKSLLAVSVLVQRFALAVSDKLRVDGQIAHHNSWHLLSAYVLGKAFCLSPFAHFHTQ